MYELETKPRTVAIYARVSTEHEAQINALENQIDWYRPILLSKPQWSLYGQYVDEGITGTSAEKRPQFMKMIEDASRRKFDLIITREVSRFARNTVDTLQYTRKLKTYGVEVFFINDNIKTFDCDGELRLTIMATLAQEESRKTSARVKAGQHTSMINGVIYGNGNILGYDRVGKKMVINPEQAKTVRMIFDMYLSGLGVTKIQYELEKAGRLTSKGNTKWYASYISHLLKNSFYCGIMTYHKEYTPDYLIQKKIVNHGEIDKIQVKGKHEPIISIDEFEEVQRIIKSKTQNRVIDENRSGSIGKKNYSSVWGKLLICQCGKKFNVHYHDRKYRTPGTYFQCYTTVNRGSQSERIKKELSLDNTCDSPYIPGWKLELMAIYVFEKYIQNYDSTVDLAISILEKHISDKDEIIDNTDLIHQKKEQIKKLEKKLSNLFEMREDGEIDKIYFKNRKLELENTILKLNDEIIHLSPNEVEKTRNDFTKILKKLKSHLKSYDKHNGTIIPENIIDAFIERIWVSKSEFRWYLRYDSEENGDFESKEHIKIGEFKIDYNQAKDYLYSFSKRRRVYNWIDLNVSVWI